MKSKCTFLFWIALCMCLGNQSVFAQEKYGFGSKVEDEIHLVYQKYQTDRVVPGRSGEQVTWDFTDLQKAKEQVEKYIKPADSLTKAEFPEANYMERYKGKDSVWTALKDEFGRRYRLGYLDKEAHLKITYPNPMLLMRFPVVYNDVVSKSYTSIFMKDFKTFTGEGRVKMEVDGYGSLLMPDKVYPNVLRVRINGKQTDMIEKYETSHASSSTTYMWFEENAKYPLLILDKKVSENKEYKEVLYLQKSEVETPQNFNRYWKEYE